MQKLSALKLRFRNFMSFGNAWNEIVFEDNISTFISGENHDVGGNNGCGKTSILNAITYAVYNKPYENISLPRLINSTNAAKNTLMEVEFSFAKGDDVYSIYRKRGESHGVALTKNDEDITPDSIAETDNLIQSIIGFGYDLFTRVIVFAGSSTPFLDLPVSQQRNHIEELFNISILSEKAVKLKKLIQVTESDIKVQEAVLKEKETAAKIQQRRLDEMEQKVIGWENITAQNITKLKAELSQIEGIDFDTEQQLFTKNTELTAQISKISSDRSSMQRAIGRTGIELSNKIKELDHLTKDNCPYCLQQMPNASEKIADLEVEVLKLDETITQLNEEEDDLHKKLQAAEALKSEISGQIKYPNLPALLETKSNFDVIQSKLHQFEVAINPHFETFEELEAEAKIQPDYSSLDLLKSRLDHQQFLLKLLTDKNSFIRRRIISKTIPFLNLQLNTYSKQLGLPHVVNFCDDMSCVVSEFGRELDFGNLSSGEKKRVNLAMSLAFRDVLHHLHARVNLLFVDEIDASLCPLGVENVIKMLKVKTNDDNLSSFVVMHRAEASGRFDKDLVIHKRGGFSEMEYRLP